MKFNDRDDNYTLSTGRRLYANRGILGLDNYGKRDHMTEGYDGTVDVDRPPREHRFDWEEPELTDDERKEIAAFMIERWLRWAESSSSRSRREHDAPATEQKD